MSLLGERWEYFCGFVYVFSTFLTYNGIRNLTQKMAEAAIQHLGDHSEFESQHLGDDPKQQKVLTILDNLLEHVNTSTDINAKLLGRLTKHPFVHISHQFWHSYSDLTYGPTFYLVAHVAPDKEAGGQESLHLQLAAFNGKRLQNLAEKFTLQDNIGEVVQHSQLLGYFIRGEVRLCKGLPKSAKSLNDSAALREAIEERIIGRSRQCQFAVLKIASNESSNQVCHDCQSHVPISKHIIGRIDPAEILEQIKNEPHGGMQEDTDDDVVDDDFGDIFEDGGVQVVNVTTNVLQNRLSLLKGITINKASEKDPPEAVAKETTSSSTDHDIAEDTSFLEPQVNLTVSVQDGDKRKELLLTELRKDLDVEGERERIREPVKASKRKRRPLPETFSEKRHKKLMYKQAREETEKPAGERHVKNCPVCDKPFTDIGEFMTHLSTCDFQPSGSEDDDDNAGGGDDGASEEDLDFKPVLDQNGKAMPSEHRTKKKKKKKSQPKKKSLVTPECTVCMTTFKHETSFPGHMKAHEDKIDINEPMVCPVCTIEVESRKALNPHIKEHHPDKGGCCIECREFMPVRSFFAASLYIN
jgi:hypothetical protein